jgi:hypothetical protein
MTTVKVVVIVWFLGMVLLLFTFFSSQISLNNSYEDYNDLSIKYQELDLQYKNLKISSIDNSNILNKIKSLNFSCESKTTCNCYEPETTLGALLKQNARVRDYELNVYDCTEFSDELARRLKVQGFKAKTKIVNVNCDTWTDDWITLEKQSGYSYKMCKENNRHKIVELNKVYIELDGEFIMPKNYGNYGLN